MSKGFSFLTENEKTPSGNIKRHLRVIITNADANNDYLTVPIDKWQEDKKGQDSSCILEAGCHPFVTLKSWVNYSYAKSMSFSEILNGIHKGLLIKKEEFAPEIVKAIQDGAKKTKYIKKQFKAMFAYF